MTNPFRNILIAAGAVAATFASAAPAAACSGESYIGSICITAANYCPEGYLEANGQTLPIKDYQALYSLIGSIYGPYNNTNFTLPDLRGRTPVGTGAAPNLSTIRQGEQRGQESVVLQSQQLPLTSTLVDPGQKISVSAPASNSGTAQPVPTIPPQLGLLYCISNTGIYPPRS